MKKLSLFIIFLLSTSVLWAQTQRTKYNFNSDWKVYVGDAKDGDAVSFPDASWKKVTLPYAWNEDEAFKKDIKDNVFEISCRNFRLFSN